MMYPDHSGIHMSYERFLELYPMNWQLVTIYVQGDSYVDSEGKMDQESEIEKYKAFAKLLTDNKYVKSSVIIAYVTPDEIKESVEKINEDFDRWKETRLNWVEKRG